MNRFIRGAGVVLSAVMFLMLVPAGAVLIYSLVMRDRSSDTVPFLTFIADIVFSAVTFTLQGADLAMLGMFLTVWRKRKMALSCVFLFGGLLLNMVFAGMNMLIRDNAGGYPVIYCLAAGMLFLASALMLSVGQEVPEKKKSP